MKYIYINAFFIKKLYEKIIFFANNQKKEKYKFGQKKNWRMANILYKKTVCFMSL